MYTNKSFKKTNRLKLSFDDYELEAITKFMTLNGGETAAELRGIIVQHVSEFLTIQEATTASQVYKNITRYSH